MKYYDTTQIREKDAIYNFIIGERSNGKTTALLRDIIRDFYKTGKRGAIIRQMEEDVKGAKGASLFEGVVAGDMVSEMTDGEYQSVRFRNRQYYLVKIDDEGNETVSKDPFAFIFALSQSIHYKSNAYPNIGTIFFDEFMRADGVYLTDEVNLFLNLVSTIVREKAVAKIFLVANTVSWNNPYFTMFGIKNVANMAPGNIFIYEYKKKRPSGVELLMTVALEYCESVASKYGGKASDVYFVIDDERVDMITDGTFAVISFPQCPHAFTTKNVKATYWIHTAKKKYDPKDPDAEPIIRARLIRVNRELFIFVEYVPVSIYQACKEEKDIEYSLEFTSNPFHYICPGKIYKDIRTSYMAQAIATSRLFFGDIFAGEDFTYYVRQSAERNVMNRG